MNKQLYRVQQLLHLGRKISLLSDQLQELGITAICLHDIESEIEQLVYEELDLDIESISPLGQSIARCIVSRDIEVGELLRRIRDPSS